MEMTLTQAVQNVTIACSSFNGNLDQHKMLQQSLDMIRAATKITSPEQELKGVKERLESLNAEQLDALHKPKDT